MGFTSDACWFLFMKTLLIKNNKKREAALKNEAGGDKMFFFTWPYVKKERVSEQEKMLKLLLHLHLLMLTIFTCS